MLSKYEEIKRLKLNAKESRNLSLFSIALASIIALCNIYTMIKTKNNSIEPSPFEISHDFYGNGVTILPLVKYDSIKNSIPEKVKSNLKANKNKTDKELDEFKIKNENKYYKNIEGPKTK